ncbi:lantibiotic immunity ABC transporter MutE/EpiE family permease subunit [Thermoactinomyces intermedius]|jgi:lantibiotic transport system permease protein|uniref:Lantibiotic immunity ABC transporter MutE/EpiE family permease subunit n=1 Tax=Thermoactinomyces intermedius TaxID=2024 RepID=A0A8I1AFL9_THEIN|nr:MULTISPECIES: lantibiotic immunity ABC transporter MutE/EpiE family permease subunit [Thermoactinomyces]MBA4550099.1 lantibiotic immunity ABC transporter MutE/EpiE family permease subunit [Thermoactinomyces intermedius]MBA4837735.1 lantibiotic immunity ABC transporter MutE/EpiE family permease subunit [Thermoactinomyces intermedius]MBH8596424.1 lantibiotic immunity ABC transporter MutE/EpiE family permease subunit [Thermoactinomyces intermedius]MBH8602537.1 lantibiotic immunity ABC transport
MINVIRAEWLKTKRTFLRRFTILAPMFLILIAVVQKLFMPVDYLRPWDELLYQIFNWSPVTFVPMGIALMASLTQVQEKRAGNYRNLRTLSLPPAVIWTGKLIILAIYFLIATILILFVTILVGIISAEGSIPWIQLFSAGSIMWIASLSIIPLQLWAAVCRGTVASMSLGIAGLIMGVIMAPSSKWALIPWSLPIRLMCPTVGVHPNGIPLKAGDPLLDESVIPTGIAISIGMTIIFSLLTALWFQRKEIS